MGSEDSDRRRRTVWVGELGPRLFEDDKFFESCVTGDALGEGTGKVMREEFTGRFLHYGFIEYTTDAGATNAVEYAGKQALVIPPGGSPMPLSVSRVEADVTPLTTSIANGLTSSLGFTGDHDEIVLVDYNKLTDLERSFVMQQRQAREYHWMNMRAMEEYVLDEQRKLLKQHTDSYEEEMEKLNLCDNLIKKAEQLEEFAWGARRTGQTGHRGGN